MNLAIKRTETFVDQVVKVVKERIATGEHGPGKKLPSENELSRELKVSRATARSAYIKLSAEGVVKRIHGDGTYVRKRIPDLISAKSGVWDFVHLIEHRGFTPSITGFRINQRAPKEGEAKVLDLSMEDSVVSVRRIIYANQDPVFYSQNVYSAKWFNHDIYKLDLNLGLFDFTKKYTDQELASVLLMIGGGLWEDDIADYEDVKMNSDENCFWIRLEEVFYNSEENPLVYGLTYVQNIVLPIRIGLKGFDK